MRTNLECWVRQLGGMAARRLPVVCAALALAASGCGAQDGGEDELDEPEELDTIAEAALFDPGTAEMRLWKTDGVLGKVPYTIAYTGCASTIEAAIAHYHAYTGIQFVAKKDTDEAWIKFIADSDVSHVDGYGKQSGANRIHLKGCYKHVVIHEIGHELGLMHEQKRYDRDSHIVVHWDQIQTEHKDQFYKRGNADGDYGAYDHNSIMHYPSTWFATGSKPTMTKKINGVDTGEPIGRNKVLSSRDIAVIAHLYGGGATPSDESVAAQSGRLETLGKCATIEPEQLLVSGAKVVMRDCNDLSKQKWERIKGDRALVNQRSDLCAHVVGSVASGSLVEQRACDGSSNQQWKLAEAMIVSKLTFSDGSPVCLDVPAANYASGTQLIRWSCHGGSNQRFDFRPKYKELVVGGMCVAAQGGAGPGNAVVLEACNGSLRQQWLQGARGFQSMQDPGYCMALSGDKVVTAACNDSAAQTFAFWGEISPQSNTSLCLKGSSTLDYQLRLVSCTGASSQQWKLWSPE